MPDLSISQIGSGSGSAGAFPFAGSRLTGRLPGRSFRGGGGYNIPNQYANPGARFLRVAITSRTSASDVITAQSRAQFSHPAMMMLPRAFLIAYELCSSGGVFVKCRARPAVYPEQLGYRRKLAEILGED
jgi:hypothetical protein